MSKLIAGIAGAICLGLTATMASAAPVGVAGAGAPASAESGITLVHGRHYACERDKWGWHRSTKFGREECGPGVRRRVNPALPLALWIWRCADGHCGYWHRNEHRWRDGGPRRNRH